MKDEHKAKEQLINELVEMRQQIAELEASETERKWAEEALREREAHLQAVFEAAENISFVTMDLTGTEPHILDFSPGAERIFGYSRREVIGKPVAMLHLPEDMARFPEVLEAMHQRKSGFTGESTLVRKSGEEFPTLFTTYPIFDAEGNMTATLSVSIDITERKRTENELRIKDHAIASSISGIVLVDLDGTIIYVNQTYLDMFAYNSVEEAVGHRLAEVAADKEIARMLFTAIQARGWWRGELRAPLRDGTTIDILLSASLVRAEEGVPIAIMGSVIDITERKRAEEALRESEASYRELADSIADVFFAMDRDLRYTYWNKASENLTGISAEAAIGKSLYELFPDAEGTKAEEAYLEALRRQQPQSFVNEYQLGGKDFFFEISAYPSRNGISVFVKDITERKRAEEALQESKDLLHVVIDATPALIIVKDRDGKFVLANEETARLYGCTPGEMVGKNLPELVDMSPSDRILFDEYLEGDREVIDSKQPHFIPEEPLTFPDGTTMWVQTTQVPLAIEGNPDCMLSIGTDITERKRAEEALRRRNRELALLNRAGQAFSSTLDLDQVLVTVLEEVRRLLDVVACSAWLIDPETNDLVCRQAVGPQSEIVRGWRLAPGEGIAGWVACSGESLIAPDVRADERHFKDVDRQTGLPLRSILSVPLRLKEDVIGVLQVVAREVGRFGPADLTLLEPLATAAAIAIENARLFQESQRRTGEMAALRQVNLATLSSLERDQVFEIMLEQLGTVIDYDTVAIKVITPDGRDKMVAGRGPVIYDQAMWDGFDAKDNKLVQEMRETRRPVVVHDTHTDERYTRVGNWETFRSWAGSPLFVKDDLIGYLAVEKTSPGFYEKIAIQLLGDFAHAAAIALENARLYEQARRDAETRSVLLREVNHRVQNNLTAIIGLLYAARRRAGMEDQAVYQSIMQDLVSRVQGLSTVHSLFSASGWAPLRLSELAAQVIQSSLQMLPRDKRVSVEVSPSPVRVTPDQAHNLALVINELTTNTVKHTLWERNTGHLTVRIALEDATVLFEFRDDGPGYPEEVLQLKCHDVGLDLIQNIVRKGLRGELSLHNDHGAVAVIQFKAKA